MSIKEVLIVCMVLVLGAALSPVFAATPVMVKKNLFSEDRKPPSPQSGSASSRRAGKGMAIGDIQLDGVVFRNNSRRAVLRFKNVPLWAAGAQGPPAPPFVAVHVGDMVNEYRVTKIEVQRVTLEKDGQTYTIGLFAANKIAAPASPAPPAAAGPAPNVAAAPARGPAGPVKGPVHPPGPVLQRGLQPQRPGQALGARMPLPPGRPPAGFVGRPPGAVPPYQRAN